MSKTRKYFITLNNPETVPLDHSKIPKDVRYMCYQLERGENGTPHIQGYCELFKPQRLSWMKKWLSDRVHCEKPRGERNGVRAYCMKEGTRVDGPWEFGVWIENDGGKPALRESMKRAMSGETLESIMIDDPESYSRHKGALKKARSIFYQKDFINKYKDLELLPWQLGLRLQLLGEAEDRTVFWVFGSRGGEGKSTCAKHLVAKHNAFMLNAGRNKDIIFAYDYQKIVIMICQVSRYQI